MHFLSKSSRACQTIITAGRHRQFGWICNPTALIISICNAIIYDFLRLLRIQNPDIKGGRIANPTGQGTGPLENKQQAERQIRPNT